MNPSNTEWQRFISKENFDLAWQRVTWSRRFEVKDRLGIDILASQNEIHLGILRDLIEKQEYSPSDADCFYQVKADKTLRPFHFLNIHDRVVYQAIGNIIIENCRKDLAGFADKSLFAHIPQPLYKGKAPSFFPLRPIDSSTKRNSNQKGQYEKFEDAVLKNLKHFAKNHPHSWMVRLDISSFYPSVDHGLLLKTLCDNNWLSDQRTLDILSACLSKWVITENGWTHNQGIPIGYETSDILSTLFLHYIDKEMQGKRKFLRFVDDMYCFSPTKVEAFQTLVNIDLSLQKRTLIRNSAKTECTEIGSKIIDEREAKQEIRKKRSFLNVELDGPEEDNNEAQDELYKMFYDIFRNLNQYCDSQFLRENESDLAFILYRLTQLDDFVRDVAFCLLEECPHRSIQCTTYLSRFENDRYVGGRLLAIAQATETFTQVKIHCVNAIKKITGFDRQIIALAQSWLQSEDWYLRYTAIDFLQDTKHISVLRDVAKFDKNLNVRIKALVDCFSLASNRQTKINAINYAIDKKENAWQIAGIYLWRRQIDINREELNLSPIKECFEQLIFSFEEMQKFDEFTKIIEQIFNLDINTGLKRHLPVDFVKGANQLLLNAIDASKNVNESIKAFDGFTRKLIEFSIQRNTPNFTGVDWSTLLNHVDQATYINTEKLRSFMGLISRGDNITHQQKNKLIFDIKEVIACHLEIIHNAFGLTLSSLSQKLLDSRRGIMSFSQTTIEAGINFLIGVGTLAANELKQRWNLRYKNKQSGEVTTVEIQQNNPDTSQQLIQLISNLNVSENELKRCIELTDLYKSRIHEWKKQKMYAEEELTIGRMDGIQYRYRIEELDNKIQDCVQKINDELTQLGIIVSKDENSEPV